MPKYIVFKHGVTVLLAFLMIGFFTPYTLAAANNALYQFEPDPNYTQDDIKAVFKVFSSLPQPIIEWETVDGQPLRCHPTGESGCTTYIQYSTNGYPISAYGELFISGQGRPSGTYTAIYTYCASFIYGTNICSWRAELVRANFTIGLYTITGNAGIANATLNYMDGTNRTAAADSSGNYTIPVPSGWSGKVIPSKTGYAFSPTSKTYASLGENFTDQNYAAYEVGYFYLPMILK